MLGVPRDASQEDVKRAYRKLSKEWHPDRHPSTGSGQAKKEAEQKFKELNEAYEVLGNPERRRMYDQFGTTGGNANGGPGFGGFNFNGFDFSSFGDAADIGSIFENFFGGERRRGREEEEPRRVEVSVTLQDVFAGTAVPLRMRRMAVCATCRGSGAASGAGTTSCATCGGTGQVERTVQSFFGRIRQRSVCTTCRGKGTIPKESCASCKGEGRVQETEELRVKIPQGIEDGQVLRLTGKGDAGWRTGEADDLFVRVRVRSDPRFERSGADIHSAATIPAIDAMLGAAITIETIQGASTVQIPEGLQPGQVLRLKGKGLPVLGMSRLGDHYVKIDVEIPKKLSRAERKILEEWRKTQ